MKTSFFCIIILLNFKGMAQLHSGTPVVQSTAQPVPNATTSEKSAPPQPINIPPAANPVPPVYSGSEAKTVEMPTQIINPPATPAGTQPNQKEPLSPIESTNKLQPNRPPRDQASREHKATAVSPNVSIRTRTTSEKNYNNNKTEVDSKKTSSVTSNKTLTPFKKVASKKL